LRRALSWWAVAFCSLLAVALVLALWWFVTRGEAEERIVGPLALPSPRETFREFGVLWFDRALTRNTLVTLQRVTLGFALAVAVGVPLGVLAGCFSAARAFLAPAVVFGRNIPLAALIPLTFYFFGIGEWQKVMFIFIACVAFVIADVTLAISDISSRYVDTAYTLGANTWQTIIKVLVPLAMPPIFDSMRVLFGLAFGYIMLAELVKLGNESGGLGHLILVSQREGPRTHIYLIILIIPLVALAIDRFLFWVQRELFPHRYGGAGVFHHLLRGLLHLWDDVKCLAIRPLLAWIRRAVGWLLAWIMRGIGRVRRDKGQGEP
jgi:NitT/TauT family transport system permease protein